MGTIKINFTDKVIELEGEIEFKELINLVLDLKLPISKYKIRGFKKVSDEIGIFQRPSLFESNISLL